MKRGLNKEQRRYLHLLLANNYGPDGIYGAYNNPSQAKVNAFNAIEKECLERAGFGLCVLTASCHFFTAGYAYRDAETGELRACIELPTRTLDFAVVE